MSLAPARIGRARGVVNWIGIAICAGGLAQLAWFRSLYRLLPSEHFTDLAAFAVLGTLGIAGAISVVLGMRSERPRNEQIVGRPYL